MKTLEEVIRPVAVRVVGRTHTGRRRAENQDSFLVAELTAGGEPVYRLDSKELHPGDPPVGAFTLGPAGLLLLVADGMGGAAAGGVASELATSYMHEELIRRWIPERDRSPVRFAGALRAAVEWANARVHERAQQHLELHGMGTTMTAAGVLGDVLYVAQVGDSRAYLVREGVAAQLTTDQSVVQQMIAAGLLSPEEAEKSQHRHVILQALGIADHVQVDVTYQQLRRDDVAVLCSDGLSGLVKDTEIAAAVNDGREDPTRATAQLIELALERGAPDNVTVVLAVFEGEGLQVPGPEDAPGRRVLDLPGS
ncbi:MAG TPA: protein phosphatase 2C domain-containing protein [Longimicrobiales bacterium]|nr:protein phosphatase 2C domain-containing protein [Longimicrobiales bacterium]